MKREELKEKLLKTGYHWLNEVGIKDKELEIVFGLDKLPFNFTKQAKKQLKNAGGTYVLYKNNTPIPQFKYVLKTLIDRDQFTKIKVFIHEDCLKNPIEALWILLHELHHVAYPKYCYDNEWTDKRVEKLIKMMKEGTEPVLF